MSVPDSDALLAWQQIPLWWWTCAAALGLQATAIIAVNNHRDQIGDAQHAKRTMAVRLGNQGHRIYFTLINLLALGCWAWTAVQLPALWPVVGIACLGGVVLCRAIWRLQGPQLNPWLGKAAAVELACGVAAIIGLVLS